MAENQNNLNDVVEVEETYVEFDNGESKGSTAKNIIAYGAGAATVVLAGWKLVDLCKKGFNALKTKVQNAKEAKATKEAETNQKTE